MNLNLPEKDALSELINTGFARSASALSILVNQRVILESPSVELYPLKDIQEGLNTLEKQEMLTIHQVFGGKLSGDIMMIMDVPSASILVDLLNGKSCGPHPLSEEDRESLIEAGNIILNAFIGSFGNLLNVHISFMVPNLRVESIRHMLNSLTIDHQELEYALVVRIQFRLKLGEVSGHVIIVMGIQSLDALFNAMRAEGFL